MWAARPCMLRSAHIHPRAYSAGAATAAGRSWVSAERPRWTTAAMMAPTIGAKTYNPASPRLPVTIIGPSARGIESGARQRPAHEDVEDQGQADCNRREV